MVSPEKEQIIKKKKPSYNLTPAVDLETAAEAVRPVTITNFAGRYLVSDIIMINDDIVWRPFINPPDYEAYRNL